MKLKKPQHPEAAKGCWWVAWGPLEGAIVLPSSCGRGLGKGGQTSVRRPRPRVWTLRDADKRSMDCQEVYVEHFM